MLGHTVAASTQQHLADHVLLDITAKMAQILPPHLVDTKAMLESVHSVVTVRLVTQRHQWLVPWGHSTMQLTEKVLLIACHVSRDISVTNEVFHGLLDNASQGITAMVVRLCLILQL